VLLGDAVKGIIAVLFGNMLGKAFGLDLAVMAGIFAIAGHNWSAFARFKGGKGIATSLGVVIGLTPLTVLILIPVWVGFFVFTRYVSLASIIAVATYPVAVFFLYAGDISKLTFAVLLAILAIYRHKDNIVRLHRGEESRISFQKRKDADEK
ncbi:MAG TPA: glycerol-3-phosphate acyltransferase, partial [Bacillota bacterium]|nr:glycerol-3-phosphate acyltransferase [Bacillota bacterium]